MFPDNNWYGHKFILSKYLGIKEKQIFGSLQHGWISQFIYPFKKKNIRFYPLLFWTKHMEEFYKNKKIKNVSSIGSPFLYLCKLFEYKNKFKKSEGTLVFTSHSSQDLKQITNHELLINEVQKKFKGPYTVCFYYYDLKKNDVTNLYKKKNWRVICCTRSRVDKFSLIRQYLEIQKHNTIVCGELCSALFYAMYLKKETSVQFNSNERLNTYTIQEKEMIKSYKKKYPNLFNYVLATEEGYLLSLKELGFDCVKSKTQLRKILGFNSITKQILCKLYSKIYDIKYGKELRRGLDLDDKNLKKYKKAALNEY